MRWLEHPRAFAMSVLAGAQVMTAGSVLADLVGPRPAAMAALLTASVQVALSSYMHGTKRGTESEDFAPLIGMTEMVIPGQRFPTPE